MRDADLLLLHRDNRGVRQLGRTDVCKLVRRHKVGPLMCQRRGGQSSQTRPKRKKPKERRRRRKAEAKGKRRRMAGSDLVVELPVDDELHVVRRIGADEPDRVGAVPAVLCHDLLLKGVAGPDGERHIVSSCGSQAGRDHKPYIY